MRPRWWLLIIVILLGIFAVYDVRTYNPTLIAAQKASLPASASAPYMTPVPAVPTPLSLNLMPNVSAADRAYLTTELPTMRLVQQEVAQFSQRTGEASGNLLQQPRDAPPDMAGIDADLTLTGSDLVTIAQNFAEGVDQQDTSKLKVAVQAINDLTRRINDANDRLAPFIPVGG